MGRADPRRLVELLKESQDPSVLGRFVRHGGDKAKQTVTDLGGKTRVMELMAHENADVRYQALMTVQKLMSQHV